MTKLQTSAQKAQILHKRLMKENCAYRFILDNKPEMSSEPRFFSYDHVIETAFGEIITPDGSKPNTSMEADLFFREIEDWLEYLWKEHDIAVQLSAEKNGQEGIRIVNLA